jgi:hypothetical protein
LVSEPIEGVEIQNRYNCYKGVGVALLKDGWFLAFFERDGSEKKFFTKKPDYMDRNVYAKLIQFQKNENYNPDSERDWYHSSLRGKAAPKNARYNILVKKNEPDHELIPTNQKVAPNYEVSSARAHDGKIFVSWSKGHELEQKKTMAKIIDP